MFYADTVGTKRILDRVVAFHKEHGERWKPAGLLARLAETGKTFSDHDAERAT
jgi:3-hydroxyacyl-CoA dehydrogenase